MVTCLDHSWAAAIAQHIQRPFQPFNRMTRRKRSNTIDKPNRPSLEDLVRFHDLLIRKHEGLNSIWHSRAPIIRQSKAPSVRHSVLSAMMRPFARCVTNGLIFLMVPCCKARAKAGFIFKASRFLLKLLSFPSSQSSKKVLILSHSFI